MPNGDAGCVPNIFKLARMLEIGQRQPCCKKVGNRFLVTIVGQLVKTLPPPKKVSRYNTVSNLSNYCCSPTQKFANVLCPICCDCTSGSRYFIRKGILNKYLGIFVDYTFLHEKTCARKFGLKQKKLFYS